jgi:hypothetical protein
VVVKKVNAFGDQGDRLVVLPPEDRSLNRLAKRIRKLIPVVAVKDIWRLHELSAATPTNWSLIGTATMPLPMRPRGLRFSLA